MDHSARLLDICRRYKRIIIVPHKFPDPDSIGAGFGLSYLFKKNNINSLFCYSGTIQRKITKKMIHLLKIDIVHVKMVGLSENDGTIIVDGRPDKQNIPKLQSKIVAVIDHHEGAQKIPGIEFCDIRPTYGSCSTIITEYLIEAKLTIPASVAGALFIGLSTDTMKMLRGVRKPDLNAFSYLYSRADINFINHVLINNLELKDIEFVKRGISNLFTKGGFGFTYVGPHASSSLLGIISDFFFQIQDIDFMVTVTHDKKFLYISVRSEYSKHNSVDILGRIIEDFGEYGGHASMAGGIIDLKKLKAKGYMTLPQIFNFLQTSLLKEYRK
ncbi:MAG: DHH family phosphoesterase [bacterium]